MYIFWLTGGIGNQLFIYAAAKSIELRTKRKPLFSFVNYKFDFRSYKLDKFSIFCKKANFFQELIFRNKVSKILSFFLSKSRFLPVIIKEDLNINQFQSLLTNQTKYIIGYWQCYPYYKDAISIIREEYKLDPALINSTYLYFKNLIISSNSISIHVRRSDYLDPKNSSVFELLDSDYYNRCINDILLTNSKPTFFIFSEDIFWASTNINFSECDVFFVTNELNNDCLEFDLMKSCKINIIANSTFSWWASSLNDFSQKKIYAPLKYFKDAHLQESYLNKQMLFNPEFIYI
jgi:hypothetical protein